MFKGTCLAKHGCRRPERGAIVRPSDCLVWLKMTVGAICIQRCAFRNLAVGIRGNFSKHRCSEHYNVKVAAEGDRCKTGIPVLENRVRNNREEISGANGGW